jgi:hypothetical protein
MASMTNEGFADVYEEFKFFIEARLLALCTNTQAGGTGPNIFIPWRLGGSVMAPRNKKSIYSPCTTCIATVGKFFPPVTSGFFMLCQVNPG